MQAFMYKNLAIFLSNSLQTTVGKSDLLRNPNLVEIRAKVIFEIPILGHRETFIRTHQIKTDFANII